MNNIGLPSQLTVGGELLISSINYLKITGALRYLGYKVGGYFLNCYLDYLDATKIYTLILFCTEGG